MSFGNIGATATLARRAETRLRLDLIKPLPRGGSSSRCASPGALMNSRANMTKRSSTNIALHILWELLAAELAQLRGRRLGRPSS